MELNPGEIGFISAGDGEELKFRHYPGSKAAVIHVHGIEGHSLWFGATAAKLSGQDIAVFAFDRRGAGANQNNRGHLESWRQLLADIDRLADHIRKLSPSRPIFLIGNCWGAMAGIGYAATSNKLAGLILIAPALYLQVDMTIWEKIQIGGAYFFKDARKFRTPLTSELFTDNPIYLQFLDRDPLRLKAVTAKLYIETTKLRRLFKQKTKDLHLPLLLLQPGNDRIVKVKEVERWFSTVPSADKQLRMFPGCEHSLDFASDNQDYVNALTNWIGKHSEVGAR